MIVTESWRTAMTTAERVEAICLINRSVIRAQSLWGLEKQLGSGQEECLDELLSYTLQKISTWHGNNSLLVVYRLFFYWGSSLLSRYPLNGIPTIGDQNDQLFCCLHRTISTT